MLVLSDQLNIGFKWKFDYLSSTKHIVSRILDIRHTFFVEFFHIIVVEVGRTILRPKWVEQFRLNFGYWHILKYTARPKSTFIVTIYIMNDFDSIFARM